MKKWSEVQKELFTAEQIAESNARVAIIGELIKARNEGNISQREFEKLIGYEQPKISRRITRESIPQLDAVISVLAKLGKTLAVVPLEMVEE